jgi:hypothetical protein
VLLILLLRSGPASVGDHGAGDACRRADRVGVYADLPQEVGTKPPEVPGPEVRSQFDDFTHRLECARPHRVGGASGPLSRSG